jgi:predicted kinase
MDDYDDDMLIAIIVVLLCHDVGKTTTYKFDESCDKTEFKGHSFAGIQDAVNFVNFLDSMGLIKNIDRVLSISLIVISNNTDLKDKAIKNKHLIVNENTDILKVSKILLDCDISGAITHRKTKENTGIFMEISDFYENPRAKHDGNLRDVFFYCGVPGVGKDYCASELGYPILSFDKIRMTEYLKEYPDAIVETSLDENSPIITKKAYDYCFANEINFHQILKDEYDTIKGSIVICNASNCNRESRKKLMDVLGHANYYSIYVVSSSTKILEQDENRPDRVGPEVINKTIFNQQIPTLAEGFVETKIIFNKGKVDND